MMGGRSAASGCAPSLAMLAAVESGMIVVVEVLGQDLGEDSASEAWLVPTVSVVVDRGLWGV
ncbi:hypothetical protein [Roseomonas populi]|uniref:Uncharacterized protein n=1 Tax=Roseomonas populi TaxID=3121582 RepID=A0ABT1XDA0_9PROT|nr:hypothetical protein [Roseomonas pecuniae]MCR0985726.1 hypothetical protein [Roseomonas pecuniae]